jgi:hypothetical protein
MWTNQSVLSNLCTWHGFSWSRLFYPLGIPKLARELVGHCSLNNKHGCYRTCKVTTCIPKSLEKDRSLWRSKTHCTWWQNFCVKWSLCSPSVARGSKVEMREERRAEGLVCVCFSIYFLDFFFKMEYFEYSMSKLWTVFTFEILVSRSSKLDPYW